MFSDPFRELDQLARDLLGSASRAGRTIPLEVWRDEAHLYLAFDVPGVKQEALNVEVDCNILTLTADRPYEERGEEPLMSERAYGVFKRSIRLGDNLKLDAVEAKLDNGVLYLTIPVVEPAKPRRIAIGAREEPALESTA